MPDRELEALRARLEAIAATAAFLAEHAGDLFTIAFEAGSNGYDGAGGGSGPESSPPRAGDDYALKLWARLFREAERADAELVGLQRATLAVFKVTSPRPPRSRGSLTSGAEHRRLVTKQTERRSAGAYTPKRLEDQPAHPSAKRGNR